MGAGFDSQDVSGVTRVFNSTWLIENTSGGYDNLPKRKAFHHYTHIKMNLYGVRKRATRFKVDLVMLKDVQADFISAADANLEKRRLFDYLSRPFVYNNLNSGDVQSKNDIKILKSYEVIVSPNSLDQYGGENAVPHMQTLNWFINHNRVRRYDWRRGEPQDHVQDAGFDDEGESGHDLRVDPKYRVYLLVRALSPERRIIELPSNDVAPDPISEPSYDIVIRNKFSNPT